jgi:hypothetical protein
MAVWKLQRLGRVSSRTGEPFPPDTEIVTALFGEEEEVGEDRVRGAGFLRRDYLAAEATDELLAGAFCVWRTRTPPAKAESERRLDLALAREFLERLLADGRPERASVCMTLALLLARKRRLVIVEQGAETLEVRWPRETDVFEVPAPAVSEADAELLQQELMRLFEIGGAGPAEGSATQAPGEATADEAAPGAATSDAATSDAATRDGVAPDSEVE